MDEEKVAVVKGTASSTLRLFVSTSSPQSNASPNLRG
jgi:hypothetical protein